VIVIRVLIQYQGVEMIAKDLGSYILLLTLVFSVLSIGVQATEYKVVNTEVNAEDILKHIENSDDVNLTNCRIVGELNLSKIELKTVPMTDLQMSTSNISIEDSKFENKLDFSNAQFNNTVSFKRTFFTDSADFSYTNFNNSADFSYTNFTDSADFQGMDFFNSANFHDANFNKDANFIDARFWNDADFNYAYFNNSALFSMTKFTNDANFSGAIINDTSNFIGLDNPHKIKLTTNIPPLLNKSDEAKKAYDKETEISLQNLKGWHNKGAALNKLNKSDETIKAYDKAVEMNPLYSLACPQHSSMHHPDCHGHSLASGGNDTVSSTIYIGKTRVDLTYAKDVYGALFQPKKVLKMEFPGSVTFGKDCLISETAKIGENVTFGDNCFVAYGVEIGNGCHFGSNVIIDHDTKIDHDNVVEDYVTIGHGCELGPFNVIEHNSVLGPYNIFDRYNVIGSYIILDSDVQFGSYNTVPLMEPINGISNVSIENNVTFENFNTVDMNVQIGPYNHFGSYNRILENTSVGPLSFYSYYKYGSNNTFLAHKYDPADRILSSL
jgi:acetyltransferase-like isoleucine patch superfamily enzyme